MHKKNLVSKENYKNAYRKKKEENQNYLQNYIRISTVEFTIIWFWQRNWLKIFDPPYFCPSVFKLRGIQHKENREVLTGKIKQPKWTSSLFTKDTVYDQLLETQAQAPLLHLTLHWSLTEVANFREAPTTKQRPQNTRKLWTAKSHWNLNEIEKPLGTM